MIIQGYNVTTITYRCMQAAMLNFSEFFGYPIPSQPRTLPSICTVPKNYFVKKTSLISTIITTLFLGFSAIK